MSRTKSEDIRWKERLNNMSSAFDQLSSGVKLCKKRELSDLEKQGLIQAFEFTHELAWNVMKDFFEYQGGAELITGSRDATREAISKGLIADQADVWMEMIRSRNQTSHTYNKKVAEEIIGKISNSYYSAIEKFYKKMVGLSKSA